MSCVYICALFAGSESRNRFLRQLRCFKYIKGVSKNSMYPFLPEKGDGFRP